MELQSERETITEYSEPDFLNSVTLKTGQLLKQFAQTYSFTSSLETAFGTEIDREAVEILRQDWLSGQVLNGIKVNVTNELERALGAYSATTNTIYLSSEFVANGTLPEITAVFLEEIGHAIDSRLNRRDTVGDEGAIFSALVREEHLSNRQLQALRSEDDSTEIVVNGEPILVEQATFNVTNLSDTGSGSLRDAINQANGNGEADTITFDAALSGTINLTSGELAITEGLTIQGVGANQLTIDADGSSRVFNVNDGDAYSSIDVSISDVTITGGSDIDGAGIFNEENLTLNKSVISGNTASDKGGGIYNATNSGSDAGTLTLVNSTISGNDASYRGGGIYNYNTATITNSTIADNYAGYDGGGLFNNGEATLNQSTIAQNDIPTGGDGEGIYNGDQLNLFNTIVADHADGDVFNNGSISSGGNIVQDGSILGFNTLTADPLLDPAGLQNNGGSTPTIALQIGSPAINAGDNLRIPQDTLDEDGDSDSSEDIPFDQRGTGFDRVLNGTVDIGAFEAAIPTLIVDILADENDGDFSEGDLSLREAIATIPEDGIITFDPTLANSTIDLSTSGLGELLIDTSLTIDGESNNITIDAGGSSRVFNVDDGTGSAIDVSISDVTLTNGNSGDDGGGILNRENLTISNSTISNSYATDVGGGIINFGEITLTNSTVSGNDAGDDGGGISNQSSGIATVTNTTIENNAATDAGGGLLNSGSLTLNFSTLSQNISSDNGGGVYNYNSGDLTLNTSIISGNSATNSGGGIYNAATATLNSSTVSGNTADNDGGGLYVGSAYGVANLNNSTVSGNYAASFGGGLLISGGYGYESFYAATANISNSTIYSNAADSGGGGLYNYGGAATIKNSTIAGNSALAGYGGGIYAGSYGSYYSIANLESTIVANNNAQGSPDDIQGGEGGGTVNATSSLIENGSFTDDGANISDDPQFDPDGLKRNGGFVETIALQSGSPAIDAGSNPDGLTFDQRGKSFDRVINSQADIGAFEFQNGANTSPITVELRLFEDRGAGLVDVTSTGEIFTSNFELEVLVADGRGTPAGVVTAAYDLTYDPALVDNGDDFGSITDTANPLLTSNFPLFRDGALDNATGTITDLGAGAVDGEQGSAIGAGTPETLSILTFNEDTGRTASNFTFDLTIDPGQTGFADGVFADPSAIDFTQNVTLNDAPELDPITDPNINIAENAVATDIVLAGSEITATDDGLGNQVTFDLTTVPTDVNGDPLFQFLDTDGNFVATSPTLDFEGIFENEFPIAVTPEGEAVLDFEDTTSYNLGITASDGFKSSAEATFTVNVTDAAPTIGVDKTAITFGTPLSQFRDSASDSDLVRPAFPDIFKSIVITNTISGATETNDVLTINNFTINAPNVSIISGAVPEEGDIILNPGESHTVEFQYAPTAAGESFDLADGFVINSDAANNPAFEVGLTGQSTFDSDVDYSGDVSPSLGAVNLDDLAVLETLTFGSSVGDAGYDPTADINGDGIINRGEIVVLNGELFDSIV